MQSSNELLPSKAVRHLRLMVGAAFVDADAAVRDISVANDGFPMTLRGLRSQAARVAWLPVAEAERLYDRLAFGASGVAEMRYRCLAEQCSDNFKLVSIFIRVDLQARAGGAAGPSCSAVAAAAVSWRLARGHRRGRKSGDHPRRVAPRAGDACGR